MAEGDMIKIAKGVGTSVVEALDALEAILIAAKNAWQDDITVVWDETLGVYVAYSPLFEMNKDESEKWRE